VDDAGKIAREVKVASEPEELLAVLCYGPQDHAAIHRSDPSLLRKT
jgi:hypothetical protein